jgi:signal transduction histidine kinase
MNDAPSYFALRCDVHGDVLEVLRDDTDLELRPGFFVLGLFDRQLNPGVARFLSDLAGQRSASGLTVELQAGGRARAFRIDAALTVDGMLVMGTERQAGPDSDDFVQELVRINNEQTNALRASLKLSSRPPAALVKPVASEQDRRLLQEMSEVNSELATLQRNLAKKTVELQTLNDEKNKLMGMAAHDLRNPLTVLLAFASFLLEDLSGSAGPEQLEMITDMRDAAEHMRRLVDDLLDVSMLESGVVQLDREPFELAAAIERIAKQQLTLAAHKGIALECELDDSLGPLSLDRSKITQVVTNLVSNAFKYSPKDTTTCVRLARVGSEVRVTVQDQGPGIAADEQARLFRYFGRGAARPTGGEKSVGLGLAICRRIVEGHGGRIWVESTPGQGATFGFALPYSAPSPHE